VIVLRDELGAPVEIQGYACVFGARSNPLPEHGGGREIVLPRAFSASDFGRTKVRYGHTAAGELLAGAQLALRQDEFGLAFRVSTIPANEYSAGLVQGVATGSLCGASFMAVLDGDYIDYEGERLFAISSAVGLEDVAITSNPVFPLAGCWLAHHDRLPRQLDALRAAWREEPGQWSR
jgi:phage head maturation protease